MKRAGYVILAGIMAAGMCVGLAGCKGSPPFGEFYSLQGAYEAGILTHDELMSIAYYHNGGTRGNEAIMGEDYVPIPKDPQELSEETSWKICETAAYNYRQEYENTEASADDFKIIRYHGTYGDCVAIMMTDKFGDYDTALWTVVVADISIFYNNGNRITIWHESEENS